MVTSDGSAKKKGRPWGSKNRNQSKKAAKKRKRKSSRTNKNFAHKKGLSGIISSATKTSYRKADLVSRRKYIIKKTPCLHLTAEMRKILQTAWNAYINSSTTITIRHFALVHGLSTETWRRELKRGALGLIQRKDNKWLYPEYSADKAIDSINEGKSNMGTKMKMTVAMAMMFRHFLIRRKQSRAEDPSQTVRSVTTDNGCEFLDQKRLDRFFKAQTYYTRAYAAWEKGSVENANRIVRRFYPKGTNFNLLTRGQILQLENFINSIHRQSLNGETTNDYHSRLAKAV